MNGDREKRLTETFVTLCDTLVSEYDALEYMSMLAERTAEMLDAAAAGVILIDGRGGLSVAAASSERSRLLEVFAVAIDAGPCVDCVRSGVAVSVPDISLETTRWQRFATGAAEAGFLSFHALPMRLRDDTVGVLTVLDTKPGDLDDADRRLAQALADATTIGLLHERAVRRAETVSEQLQLALNSRVVIEQAKGVVAALRSISPDDGFVLLRSYARRNGRKLTELCRDVVNDRTAAAALFDGS
jgi:GAF domain-containing protein